MEIKPHFSDLLKDDHACRSLSERICREKGIPFRGSRILEGSNILFRTGHGLVIKIFSTEEREFCINETGFLELLQNRLPVRVPGLEATGVFNGYPYIIMEEITDLPLKKTWQKLSAGDRRTVVRQVAALLRSMHQLPVSGASFCRMNWQEFITGQVRNLRSNHRGFGLDSQRLDQVDRFIQRTGRVEEREEQVICHTEIMPEHLFLRMEKGKPVLSALIDFEPSMPAIQEYDLCAVGVFVTRGEPGLFSAFRSAYGSESNPEDIMRMLLLHRYSNLKWFISTVPEKRQQISLDRLTEYWFT